MFGCFVDCERIILARLPLTLPHLTLQACDADLDAASPSRCCVPSTLLAFAVAFDAALDAALDATSMGNVAFDAACLRRCLRSTRQAFEAAFDAKDQFEAKVYPSPLDICIQSVEYLEEFHAKVVHLERPLSVIRQPIGAAEIVPHDQRAEYSQGRHSYVKRGCALGP